MSGGISGTGEFDPGLYKIFLEDLEKSGELTPFQVKQDTIATLGRKFLGKFYLAPGSVPFLDPNYKPIFSLDKMTPEMFAWLMIRNDLDKISTILDEMIFQLSETDEGKIDLLKLLKALSDAIKELEKQIEEAKEFDSASIRERLEALAKQAEEAYEELHKAQLLLNMPEEQMRELEYILKTGGELPEKYEYIKDLFGALLDTHKGRVMLGIMLKQVIDMKEKGTQLEEFGDRRGMKRMGYSSWRVENEIEQMSMWVQEFDHTMKMLGLDPELINSIITIITQMAFKNYLQGNQKLEMIVLDLLQDEWAIFRMFESDMYSFRTGGGNITDLEKQIIGIIVTVTFTLIYMELQEVAELDGEVTEGEEALMKLALALIMLNITSNETFRELMGEDAIEYMQSEEFLNNLIFTARLLHDPEAIKEEMTLSEEEIEVIIAMLLENKADVILELLKNLKMLKAMYAAVLASIEGGSTGGNILELLKGLKAMMAGEQEEVVFQPPDRPV